MVTSGEGKPKSPAVDGNQRAIFESNEEWSCWLHGVVDDCTGDHQTSSQCDHRQTAHQVEMQQNDSDEPRHKRRPAHSNHISQSHRPNRQFFYRKTLLQNQVLVIAILTACLPFR